MPLEGWFAVAGTVLLGYGLWQIYQPAAFIVVGTVLIVFAATSAILAQIERSRQ